ncbi:hypothetical protein Tco_0004501 [Tanacetum coccineum]
MTYVGGGVLRVIVVGDTMADVNVNIHAEQALLWHHPLVQMNKSCLALDGKPTSSELLPLLRLYQLSIFSSFGTLFAMTESPGATSVKLDEQWFDLTKDTLRDALRITPINNNKAFSSPPTPDTLIQFVNDLGYPKEVRHLFDVVTNDMFQPWRALTTIINLCLTGKTSGFERPKAPVLQILWGVINRAHIDYAERMWEEFTQSIHTFTEDKKNLAQQTQGKKKATLIVIPSVRFTKLIIFHLQHKHNFHPRPVSPLYLPTDEPRDGDKKRKPVSETSEAPPPAKRPKTRKVIKKRTLKSSQQLVDEFVDEGCFLDGNLEWTLGITNHFLRFRVSKEIGKIRTSASIEPSVHEDSSSLYAELGLSDSDTESDEEVPPIVKSDAQDEGQAGPNPGKQYEG